MALSTILLLSALGLLLVSGLVYVAGRQLARRQPYRDFMALPVRGKVRFLRLLASDRRVPWIVRALPFALAAYLASPIDLIPDFIPVLGYIDDVLVVLMVLVFVVRLTPRALIDELIKRAHNDSGMATGADGR